MMDTWGTTRIPQPGYGSVTAADSGGLYWNNGAGGTPRAGSRA